MSGRKITLCVLSGLLLLAVGVVFSIQQGRQASKVQVVSHKRDFPVRFIGFTSGTNHIMAVPNGIEAKLKGLLSYVGMKPKEQTFRHVTRERSVQLWLLLRAEGTNEPLGPNQLRLQVIEPTGKTNIKEFNYAFSTVFTNNEEFGFSVALPDVPERSAGTRIELVARSANRFSRRFTNHIATVTLRE